jgi:hypothetical protein
MEKASDDYEGERDTDADLDPPALEELSEDTRGNNLKTAREEGNNPLAPDTIPGESPPRHPVPPADADDEQYPLVLVFSGGPGMIKSDDYEGMASFETAVGVYFSEKQRLELCAGLGWANVDENSDQANAIDDKTLLVNLGLRYKLFTTPRHTFLGHYFILGLNYTWMYWDYKTSIQVGAETIRSDYIGGWEFSAGMGLHLVQTRHLQLGVEAIPSVILWESTTRNGFDNDVFEDPLILKLRLTASWVN